MCIYTYVCVYVCIHTCIEVRMRIASVHVHDVDKSKPLRSCAAPLGKNTCYI